jgi:outer membrane lipoprotein-sorting protein
MKKYSLILILIFITPEALASNKEEIINNLRNTNNLSFNFEQNINGEIENGRCTIQYPKKIYCEYNLDNKKILVSNGKSLVIKTSKSYYLYPLNKTPLNFILNKDFLLKKINDLNERVVDNKYINYSFIENENKINIFFDKKNHNLIGWQMLDIFQNQNITYLHSVIKNQKVKKDLFKLPMQN